MPTALHGMDITRVNGEVSLFIFIRFYYPSPPPLTNYFLIFYGGAFTPQYLTLSTGYTSHKNVWKEMPFSVENSRTYW